MNQLVPCEEAEQEICNEEYKNSCQVLINAHMVITENASTVELQWLEHLWNHEYMLMTGVV